MHGSFQPEQRISSSPHSTHCTLARSLPRSKHYAPRDDTNNIINEKQQQQQKLVNMNIIISRPSAAGVRVRLAEAARGRGNSAGSSMHNDRTRHPLLLLAILSLALGTIRMALCSASNSLGQGRR
uniref:Uncharacterized protein n=1 Tax=Anopheles atroparvus TaxID=41427 RepID=A0A182JK91_ANOAO